MPKLKGGGLYIIEDVVDVPQVLDGLARELPGSWIATSEDAPLVLFRDWRAVALHIRNQGWPHRNVHDPARACETRVRGSCASQPWITRKGWFAAPIADTSAVDALNSCRRRQAVWQRQCSGAAEVDMRFRHSECDALLHFSAGARRRGIGSVGG